MLPVPGWRSVVESVSAMATYWRMKMLPKNVLELLVLDLLGRQHNPVKLIKSFNKSELQIIFQEMGIDNVSSIEKVKESQAIIRRKRQLCMESRKVKQNNKENRSVVNESQMTVGYEREIDM